MESSLPPSSSGEKQIRLLDIFNDVWKLYESVEDTQEPSNSKLIQEQVKKGIEKSTLAIEMVNTIGLFSDNEEIEEVSSNELRYFLLPAMLAYFTNKNLNEERLGVIRKSLLYWIDFLKLCKSYKIRDINVPKIEKEEKENDPEDDRARKKPAKASVQQDLAAGNARRQAKIEKFTKQKQLKKRLKELYPVVQQEHVDDEVKREYYLTLLERWISSAEDEIESIQHEIPIIEHMAKMRASGENMPKKENKPKSKFRPFILTKNDLQKQVFGAGYSSLPTYSVEEFYEQQVAKGLLPNPEEMKSIQAQVNRDPLADTATIEKEDVEKEEKIDKDDPETLTKARQWDDWKDDHRRGWGNRQNMG